MNSIDKDAIEVLGINPKIWKEYRKMNNSYVQDDLSGFSEAEARARESGIDKIQTQTHLAKWGLRFEKYSKFSKDPVFQRRMFLHTKRCFDLMNGHER